MIEVVAQHMTVSCAGWHHTACLAGGGSLSNYQLCAVCLSGLFKAQEIQKFEIDCAGGKETWRPLQPRAQTAAFTFW